MIDIKADIEDLRKIKDIRDELHIISSIFHIQKNIVETLDHILEDFEEQRNTMILEQERNLGPPPPFRRRDDSRAFSRRTVSPPFRRRSSSPPFRRGNPYPPSRGFRSPSRRRTPDIIYNNAGIEQDSDRQKYHSPMLEVVTRNIAEVVRLEKFAERAIQAVSQHGCLPCCSRSLY